MAAPAGDAADDRLQRLRQACVAHEIRADFAAKLRQLEGYDIVFLVDDSGSMSSRTTGTATRWSEVQQFANCVVEIATCLDPDGIDLRFLNRKGFTNVKSVSQVESAFKPPPDGGTPLSAAVRSILHDKAESIREKKMLLVIATDGQPSEGVATFRSTLTQKPPNVFVSIVACTEDEKAVGYLNEFDKNIPRVDVCDDFVSERREVLAARGPSYPFSFGDYVVKVLLGSIDSFFDQLDEKRGGGRGCCEVM